MTRMNAALRAARRGWPVLPLHKAINGKCSCNNPSCSSVGKHPLTPNGVRDATTNESIIRRWWRENPNPNIGLATGKRSNLVVFDIDARHGGMKSLKQLERDGGPLPRGPKVKTGGGGFHLYFKYSPDIVGNRVGLMPGIDVRSDGGYVVYPLSSHKSGDRYLWCEGRSPRKVSPPPVPVPLLRLVQAQKPSTPLVTELMIPEGERNSTLTSLAGTMHRRGMSYEAIEAALLEDNSRRCEPSLSNDEVCGIARSISSRYTPSDHRILSATSSNDEKAERKLHFRTGKQIGAETPPEVPWVVAPWVAFGAITEVDGKVKLAGKTTFLTHLANAVLAGSFFLDQPTSRTNVVYLTEQNLVSFRAAMERANLLACRTFHVLSWTDTIGVKWESIVRAAVEECKKRKARLLMVDTLAQFAGLAGDKENNAGDALAALRPLQQAASQGIAVIVARHERKSGGSAADSGRGSSAFAGAVDIILSIRRQDGRQPNVRLIQKESRFDGPDELLVELKDEGYVALGSPGEAAKERAADDVLSSIPNSRKNAITIEDLADVTGEKRPYLQRYLVALEKRQNISKRGKGRKGSPFRYFQR